MNKSTKKRAPEPPVLTPRQQKMLQQVSEDFPSKLNHFRKAYRGSLRSAITAKCLECLWGETKAIRECTATACPLHAARPYQEARNNTSENTGAQGAMAEVNDVSKSV